MDSSFQPRPPVAESPNQQVEQRFVRDLTGVTVGRFVVEVRLGAGGMGEVYRAVDTKLKRAVALKRITSSADGRYRQRLWTEARLASQLSDPRIASVYDVFEEDGELFLVNAYIPEYTQASRFNHEPKRIRKLLVHKREAAKLAAAIQREGMTLVPLKMYFNAKGKAKVELGIAKGKKLHDKRETEKQRDWQRDKARLMRDKG